MKLVFFLASSFARVFLFGISAGTVAANDPFGDQLNAAIKATNLAMEQIFSRWEIGKYPNFLKSAWMPRHSWDHMMAKMEQKILLTQTHKDVEFIISFTGSSVTAGHDSPFVNSYPVVLGEVMAPAFSPIGIKLVSRNAAMVIVCPCITFAI